MRTASVAAVFGVHPSAPFALASVSPRQPGVNAAASWVLLDFRPGRRLCVLRVPEELDEEVQFPVGLWELAGVREAELRAERHCVFEE
eukprot:3158931-Alexandrium_andersonii.AAC.1